MHFQPTDEDVTHTLDIDLVDPAASLLRPVRKQSAEYQALVEGIRRDGHCLNGVLCRPKDDRFQLCDGNWRYQATLDAGVKVIPSVVKVMTDEEYLARQLECNAHRYETDYIEYAARLQELWTIHNPDMTIRELAHRINHSPDWVHDTLRLNNLKDEIATKVRRGEIPVSSAKWLAKLPKQLQVLHSDDAQRMKATDFAKMLGPIVSQYRADLKKGRVHALMNRDFEPTMRRMQDIKEVLEDPDKLVPVIVAENCRTKLDAALAGVKWAFRLTKDAMEEKAAKRLEIESERQRTAELMEQEREERRLDNGEPCGTLQS